MDQPALDIQNVGKRFRLHQGGSRTLKSSVLGLLRRSGGARAFWALQDVSLRVRRGETLGIIGANGAGKSTLLSIIAGTMYPTTGHVTRRGSLSSLHELGAGFHPELTGRENVFLWGSIMGLSRAEMRKRIDAIVEFTGLHAYIDQPVKHYSSGMYVRLGFAVAVEVDPEILLIDEVLAVGDAAFQRKCLDRMADFRRRGKTMLLISHDLVTIQSISDRIILLDAGRVKGDGRPADVVGQYEAQEGVRSAQGLRREWGTGEIRLTDVALAGAAGDARNTFRWDEPICVQIRWRANVRVDDPVFGFGVADAQGRTLTGTNTAIEGLSLSPAEGEGALRLRIERLAVASGTYLLSVSAHSRDQRRQYHRLDHAFPFRVESDRQFDGIHVPCQWEVVS